MYQYYVVTELQTNTKWCFNRWEEWNDFLELCKELYRQEFDKELNLDEFFKVQLEEFEERQKVSKSTDAYYYRCS